jgi:predicted RecA/RadA family phage recombinase
MKAVYVGDGRTVEYKPIADTAAGEVIVYGQMVGVALTSLAAGQWGAIAVEGIYDVVKKPEDAFGVGERVYWHLFNGYATSTPTGFLLGKAVRSAAEGESWVRVRLTSEILTTTTTTTTLGG